MTEVGGSLRHSRSEGLTLSEITAAVIGGPEDPQPADRTPAPGDLRLVQALVNSFHNLDTRRDEFESPAGLADWLVRRELLHSEERLTHADLSRVIDVREGLRALLYANNHEPADDRAIERMNRCAARVWRCSLTPRSRPISGRLAGTWTRRWRWSRRSSPSHSSMVAGRG